MRETTKTPETKAQGQRAAERAADRAAATDHPQRKPLTDGASLDSAFEALSERIGHDARDDTAGYLLRSDTAHNGE